jgi:hypothetical protein
MLAANHRYWPIPTWSSSSRQLRWQRRRIAVDCRYSSSSKDELGSSIEFRNSLEQARSGGWRRMRSSHRQGGAFLPQRQCLLNIIGVIEEIQPKMWTTSPLVVGWIPYGSLFLCLRRYPSRRGWKRTTHPEQGRERPQFFIPPRWKIMAEAPQAFVGRK